jgi:hypothetical protein
MERDLMTKILELDEELDTTELLRKHSPSHLLYLVDYRARLIKKIERGSDPEDEETPALRTSSED